MGGSNELIDETVAEVLPAIVTPATLAVCLVSGGMDSCVTAAIAHEENNAVAFLHVSYGQLTERRERKAFDDLASFYQISQRLAVSIEYLTQIGGSSLTDKSIPITTADLSVSG